MECFLCQRPACSASSCLGPSSKAHLFFASSFLTHAPRPSSKGPQFSVPHLCPLQTHGPFKSPLPSDLHPCLPQSLASQTHALLSHSPLTTTSPDGPKLPSDCLLSQTHVPPLNLRPLSDVPHLNLRPLSAAPHLNLRPLSDPRPAPGCASPRPAVSAARRGCARAAGRRTSGGALWAAAAPRSRRPRQVPRPPPPPPQRTGSWPSPAPHRSEETSGARELPLPPRLEGDQLRSPGSLRRRQSYLPALRSRPAPSGSEHAQVLAPPPEHTPTLLGCPALPLGVNSSASLGVKVFPSEPGTPQ